MQDESGEGGIVINPHSDLGKELLKWEQVQTHYVGRGQNPGNPYVYREYPMMLYKVQPHPSGQSKCLEVPPDAAYYEKPDAYERACRIVDQFNRSCQRVVNSDDERATAEREGWRAGPKEALAYHEKLHAEMANVAAERAHSDQRMSRKAQEEVAIADADTHEHIADLPAPKLKPRGRPKKGAVHV